MCVLATIGVKAVLEDRHFDCAWRANLSCSKTTRVFAAGSSLTGGHVVACRKMSLCRVVGLGNLFIWTGLSEGLSGGSNLIHLRTLARSGIRQRPSTS